MLREENIWRWSEWDEQVAGVLVPPDHRLRRIDEAIDFERLRPLLESAYSRDLGRPPIDATALLKLEFLQYYDNLSDRQVMARLTTDVAYRHFIKLPLHYKTPDPSVLTYFRGRLGVELHRRVFDEVLAQARERGLVKNRLRLKDATEVVADVAIPAALALAAQMRDKLLAAAEPFDAVRVEGERIRSEVMHASTQGQSPEERLTARVTHLREMLLWIDELAAPAEGEASKAWTRLVEARRLAHKILADQEDPKAGDRTRSTVDPDVRRGRHGDWYDGYLLDVMIDADSQLVTSLNVLPANGDEAADAAELVRGEEEAHGEDIEQLSIDGIGFQGPVLRELQDPQGLNLEVFTPPKAEQPTENYGREMFVEDAAEGTLTCPAGRTTDKRDRNRRDTAWIYRFAPSGCRECALRAACLANPLGRSGRSVQKNDYQLEYDQARQKASTPEYAAVRREHPAVERKLGEIVNRHGGRRARYRGRAKVLCQQLMTATTVNIKRIVRLLEAPPAAPAGV